MAGLGICCAAGEEVSFLSVYKYTYVSTVHFWFSDINVLFTNDRVSKSAKWHPHLLLLQTQKKKSLTTSSSAAGQPVWWSQLV